MVSNQTYASKAIVVTGLPASGKTTIGKIIAAELNFPLFDKDGFLERLFDEYPSGDAPTRRELSRKSDVIFESEAKKESSTVLVSHWRPVGKVGNSGTPTEWLLENYDTVIEVTCVCDARTAAERFSSRKRHSGHEDQLKSLDEIEAWMVSISDWYPLDPVRCISVNTELGIDTSKLKQLIEASF